MGFQRQDPGRSFLFLLVLFSLIVGCSGGSSTPGGGSSELSAIQEKSSASQAITATSGGSVALDAVTLTFPVNALPADALIKISKVSVSGDEESEDDDASAIDMTDAYTISTTSETNVELASSANITFKVNPAGFDPESIRLVVWDGYEWDEVPASYDENLGVVSATVDAIMPFGNRIYLANPGASSTRKREGGEQIVSQFVALKVVGERLESAGSQNVIFGKCDRSKGLCRKRGHPKHRR